MHEKVSEKLFGAKRFVLRKNAKTLLSQIDGNFACGKYIPYYPSFCCSIVI